MAILPGGVSRRQSPLRSRPGRAILVACAGVVVFACSSGSDPRPVLVPAEPIGCVNLTEECILPFPTNLVTRKANTRTGIVLDLSEENFPGETSQRVLALYPPDLLNVHDGFSAVAPVAASLPAEPDTASFPASLEESVAPASPVRLVNLRTREQVPVRVKLDPKGLALDPPRTLLSILPAKPLDPGDTFAALLTTRIRTAGGGPMPRYPNFARVAGSAPAGDAALDRIQAAYAPFLDLVERELGENRDGLVLAWAFTVRSDGDVTGILRHVRKAVLDRAARKPPAAEITQINPPLPFFEPTVDMAILGSYPTPEYRGEGRLIQFDEDGYPIEQRENRLEFLLKLPRDAARPAPVVVFGHGLTVFKETMFQVTDDLARAGFAVIGIDVGGHGSRIAEDGTIFGYFQFEKILMTRDLFIQTIADEMQLVRLVQGDLATLDLLPDGTGDGVPDLDTREIYYIGQSLGTVLGATFASLDPEIASIALNVPGGGFVGIIEESALLSATILDHYVPAGATPSEQLVLMNLGQMLVDDIDPLNFARHMRAEPFGGDPSRDVLLQESIGDGIVPNAAAESLARAIRVPLVTPSITQVYGLATTPAPAESAGLFQFQISENPILAHGLLLMTPKAGSQVATFFSTHAETGTGLIVSP